MILPLTQQHIQVHLLQCLLIIHESLQPGAHQWLVVEKVFLKVGTISLKDTGNMDVGMSC